MFSLTPIKTQPQLQEAVLGTYLFDAVIAVALIILFIIIANLIPWQGGKNDSSGNTRRMWFWIMGAVTLFACMAFNYFCYMGNILVPTFKMDYVLHLVLGSIMAAVIYFIVLFLIIKLQKKQTKLWSVCPSNK